MRSTPEPAERPLVLPPKAPPAPAPTPDPARQFEIGDWSKTLPDGIKPTPAPPDPDLSETWVFMSRP